MPSRAINGVPTSVVKFGINISGNRFAALRCISTALSSNDLSRGCKAPVAGFRSAASTTRIDTCTSVSPSGVVTFLTFLSLPRWSVCRAKGISGAACGLTGSAAGAGWATGAGAAGGALPNVCSKSASTLANFSGLKFLWPLSLANLCDCSSL